MKTERFNLMISAKEKAALMRRAKTLGVSTSELVRRAVAAYEPDRDDAELEALAGAFLASVAHAERALEAVIDRVEGLDERLARMRDQGRAEAHEGGESWPFVLPNEREAAQ